MRSIVLLLRVSACMLLLLLAAGCHKSPALRAPFAAGVPARTNRQQTAPLGRKIWQLPQDGFPIVSLAF